MTKTITEQVLNLQKMVEDECSRRCELKKRLADEIAVSDELLNVQKRLEKKLDIATKALKQYKEDYFLTTYGGRLVNPYPDIARKALKEMEGVK